MQLDWKANSRVVITGLVSIICWIGFAASVLPPVRNQTIGGILVIIAIVSLLWFGYLLDKRLESVI